MGLGHRLIQRRHKLKDDIKDRVDLKIGDKFKSTRVLADSPGAFDAVREFRRRQDRNFSKDSLDRKKDLTWYRTVTIARYDFNTSDYGLKITLPATSEVAGEGLREGDEIKILTKPHIAAIAPLGRIVLTTGIAGSDLTDGNSFTISDGVHTATVFEFDNNASVSPSTYLKAVAFTNGDNQATILATLLAAINNATSGTFTIAATASGLATLNLANSLAGTTGNVAITHSTEAKVTYSGMACGVAARGSALAGKRYAVRTDTVNVSDVPAGYARKVSATILRLPDSASFVSESATRIRVVAGAGVRNKSDKATSANRSTSERAKVSEIVTVEITGP